jgi:DNA-binding transcriptional MerR regulator
MKIAELSERAGVSLPTIKFYIREKLLPSGQASARNQADYSAEHLERLALIRSLRDDAGLSIESIGRALHAADTAKEDFLVAAIDAIQSPTVARADVRTTEFKSAHAFLLGCCADRGWNVDSNDVSVQDAAQALAIIRRSFPYPVDESVALYLEHAEFIAAHEIPDNWRPEQTPNAALRFAVLGTVLVEPFILALRRAAHVSRARRVMARAEEAAGKTRSRAPAQRRVHARATPQAGKRPKKRRPT